MPVNQCQLLRSSSPLGLAELLVALYLLRGEINHTVLPDFYMYHNRIHLDLVGAVILKISEYWALNDFYAIVSNLESQSSTRCYLQRLLTITQTPGIVQEARRPKNISIAFWQLCTRE